MFLSITFEQCNWSFFLLLIYPLPNSESCKSLQATYCSYPLCLYGFLCSSFCSDIYVSYLFFALTLNYKSYFPVLSYDALLIDIYGLILSSASAIKETPLKLSYVYQCVGCDSFHLQSVGRTINKVSCPLRPFNLPSKMSYFFPNLIYTF